jgi:hypothetical protein
MPQAESSMTEPLAIYFHDHLAGAAFAIDLVESLGNQHLGKPLGEFAAELLVEIETDRETLLTLADRLGITSSPLKDLSAWLGEKVSRIKLSSQEANSFGTFEALEILQVGIHGKWALWRALNIVALIDVRLQSIDFAHLAARAEHQEALVDGWRLEEARTAFPCHP